MPSLDLSGAALADCRLCPRRCGVDRTAGPAGYCRTGAGLAVASICLHRGEEPPVSGPAGIANLFFAHCNLRCAYCQNRQISRPDSPLREWSMEHVLRELEACFQAGATALGFVSPSHQLPQMLEIIDAVRAAGHRPVVVCNTSAYDRPEALAALDGHVDVWLPDFKYADPALAAALSDAPDYPDVALAALREMRRQSGTGLELDDEVRAIHGIIVRHLVLPGHVDNSVQALRLLAEELGTNVHVSLMSQYHPVSSVPGHPELDRTLTAAEFDEVKVAFDTLGFRNGWVQELDSPESYLPDFAADGHPFERS